ncbi:MAG: septum formation initiator family protein [Eubacteriales bacterium]|nr:septum formation initiator family protein [Eubacteriales bacterium]
MSRSSRAKRGLESGTQRRAFSNSGLLLFLLILLFMATSLVAAYNVITRQFAEERRLEVEQEELSRRVDSLKEEGNRLKKRLDQVGTPGYVEDVARSELGMVKSDEIVFVDEAD